MSTVFKTLHPIFFLLATSQKKDQCTRTALGWAYLNWSWKRSRQLEERSYSDTDPEECKVHQLHPAFFLLGPITILAQTDHKPHHHQPITSPDHKPRSQALITSPITISPDHKPHPLITRLLSSLLHWSKSWIDLFYFLISNPCTSYQEWESKQ